jgi:DNA modification methylase
MANVILYDNFLSKISDIATYSRNARQHSTEQIAQIVRSITEFGFTSPVLLDENGVLIAGHGRLAAARQLGMVEVPAIAIHGLDEARKQALRIADNKLALNASWDDDLLRTELMDLRDVGFDLGLTGFGEQELAGLFADMNDGLTDPDDVPEPPAEPVTRLGDVWTLGRHRLVCGDSTDAGVVEAALEGVKPHLMVTDPPYGVEYDPDWRNRADRANGKPFGARAIGTVVNDKRADWRDAWALFSGDVAYVWSAPGPLQCVSHDSLVAAGFEPRQQIIWAKDRAAISRGNYNYQHEPCWYAVRGKTYWIGDKTQTSLWQIRLPWDNYGNRETPKSDERSGGHSTQKPVECMRRPIENNSSPGQAVYDPFVGSGTTIIAAEMTGRACHAIEISPTYVDVAVLRWQAFTGQTATRQDGTSFPTTSGAKTVHPDRGAASANPDDDRLRYASGGNVRMPEDQQADVASAFPPRAGHRDDGGQHAGGPGALHQLHQEHERAGTDLVDESPHGLEGHQRTGRHANASDDHNRGNP